jgi:hypothetical protein
MEKVLQRGDAVSDAGEESRINADAIALLKFACPVFYRLCFRKLV